MSDLGKTPPEGYREVFCKRIRTKDGGYRYPVNSKFFHFYVKDR